MSSDGAAIDYVSLQVAQNQPSTNSVTAHIDLASSSPSTNDSVFTSSSSIGNGHIEQGEKDIALHTGAEDVNVDQENTGVGDVSGSSDTAGSNEDGQQEFTLEENYEIKRVKVYELVGARWVDQGTAFCIGFAEREGAFLTARAETDPHTVILQTTIRSTDVYQRQQDTLIVWTEPDGVDYALSFQDPEGCAEVWNFIVTQQRRMNAEEQVETSSPEIGPEPMASSSSSVTTASIIRSGRLPVPQLGIISEIERAIKALGRTAALKERLCEYIQQEEYIKLLADVFNQAEDLESLENLHALCSIMQTILMLNDHSMYEHILDDELFFGVVGMLEYDPEFPAYKANYREFLGQTSRFHQPIPIRDEIIQKKIHHTYRLLFLKDVVLARAIDDSTFNVLNSCIIFNQIDIITHVQGDEVFLKEIVDIFEDEAADKDENRAARKEENANEKKAEDAMDVDENSSPPRVSNGFTPNQDAQHRTLDRSDGHRQEVIVLIQQLCAMGKNVQLPARMALFRTLVDRGLLSSVQWAFSHSEKTEEGRHLIAAAGEIFAAMLDHDTLGVRLYVLSKQVPMIEKAAGKPGAGKMETLLMLMCKVMAKSRDLGVQSLIGDALKMLLEVPQNEGLEPPNSVTGIKMLGRGKDDPNTDRFLSYFYKQCIDTLFKPFGDIPEFKNVTDPTLGLTREKSNLYLYLCDLLSSFAVQHSFRSHFYILSSNVAARVASLLSARDKHLRLAAFRFFRATLKVANRNMLVHLMKLDYMKPILDLTVQESRRDNLISSSCQEYFEHMRRENMKELITYCMTIHGATIRKLSESGLGSVRFKAFIRRYEMNSEPPPLETNKPNKPNGPPLWGQKRMVEAEEESYFNTDDDEEDSSAFNSAFSRGGQGTPPPHLVKQRKRLRPAPMRVRRPPNPSPPSLGSLLDYGDDDDLSGLISSEPSSSRTGPASSSMSNLSGSPRPTSEVEVPSSPMLSHRQILLSKPSRPSRPTEDEEDRQLEALVSKSDPPSPSLSGGFNSMGPKRRRDDDDDDGLLERLSNKAKRPNVGVSAQKEEGLSGRAGTSRSGEDGPRKIKLKFGATGLAVASASPSPAPSEPSAKDGDTG